MALATDFPVVALPGSEPASEDEGGAEASGFLPGDEPKASGHNKKADAGYRSSHSSDTESESEAEAEAQLPGDDEPKSAGYAPSSADIDKVRDLMASMQMKSDDDNSARRRTPRSAAKPSSASARAAKVAALKKELNAPRSAARTTVSKWRTQQASEAAGAYEDIGGIVVNVGPKFGFVPYRPDGGHMRFYYDESDFTEEEEEEEDDD